MGCATSSERPSDTLAMLNVEQGAELLDNFLRLQKEIWKQEKHPPIPALGHWVAVLDKIGAELEAAVGETSGDMQVMPGTVPQTDQHTQPPQQKLPSGYEVWDEPILKVMRELSIANSPARALEHEEFIANLTRYAMKQKRLRWLSERKLEAEEEVGRQSERVQYLQALYIQQENIIVGVTGREGPRSTVERDMERLRSYKATLYSALLAWAESSRLVSAAAQLAAKGATLWESLSSPTDRAEDLERCFSVATGTRDSIHEAALCIGRAQAALPAVQFAYCTAREITAVNQILEYLYTDLQIADRYHYGVKLYTSFQKRAKALHRWIKKTMEETIQKDVQDVELKISKLVGILSNERTDYIRQAVGLMNVVEPQDDAEDGMGTLEAPPPATYQPTTPNIYRREPPMLY